MFGIKIEKKPAPSLRSEIAVSILSIGIGLALGAVIIIGIGFSPVQIYTTLFSGAFGSPAALARTTTQTIPLLLIGVGLALAYKAEVWNIGAPGQMIVGAIAATAVALYFPIALPSPVFVALIFIASFLAAAGFAAICSYLNLKIGFDIVLSTLLLNYVAFKLLQHLIYGPMKNPDIGFPVSKMIPDAAKLPTIAGTTIHYPTLIIGIAAVVIIYFVMKRTTFGYQIRVFGENPRAAQSAGMSRFKIIMLLTAVSGGLAGLAGAGEILGNHYMLKLGVDGAGGVYATSYGYTAIIAASLGGNNAIGSALAAFFIGGILVGGQSIQVIGEIPYSLVTTILGLMFICLVAGSLVTRYNIIWRGGK